MNVCPWMAGNCAIVYIMEVERRCRRCPAIFYCLLLFIRKNNDRNRVYVIVSTDFTCVLSHEKTYFQFEFHPPTPKFKQFHRIDEYDWKNIHLTFPPKIKFLRSPDNPKYRARETRLICEWQRRSVNPRSQPSSPSQERKARGPLRRGAFLRSSSTNAEGGGEGEGGGGQTVRRYSPNDTTLSVSEEMHKFIAEQLNTSRVPLCINPQSAAFKSFAR